MGHTNNSIISLSGWQCHRCHFIMVITTDKVKLSCSILFFLISFFHTLLSSQSLFLFLSFFWFFFCIFLLFSLIPFINFLSSSSSCLSSFHFPSFHFPSFHFPFFTGKVILRKNSMELSRALFAIVSYIRKHFLYQLLLALLVTINSIPPVFTLGLKVVGKVNASFASSRFFVEVTVNHRK